jgi:branched-chain amino acid transport system substrate-binding protein
MKRATVLIALALAALSMPAQVQAPRQPIRIGLVFPLTGGSADMGNSARVGAQVAVDEITPGWRLPGPKAGTRDPRRKANNDVGVKHAQDLVLNEKVAATIGFCNSGVAMKDLDVFQTNKHLLIVPCATGTAITAKYPPADSFIFRTSARDQLQSQFLIDEIAKRGLGKVALLVDSSGYGDAGLKDLEAAIARAGLKSMATLRFKVGVQSLEDEMRQLKASGADALIGWTVGREEASPIGSMMSGAQTYDSVYLLLRAMFDSGGDLGGPALKNALENPSGSYRGVVTTYERAFSPTDHDAISANMLWLGTWRNQERGYAHKEDERRATIIRRKESAVVLK